ncbi:MAG: phosphoenolpyruvate--protein phosphotransferase, partial [bacterium]|nr:phosphoenolpyruvate--protein phosphotransferase [bacterium]
METGKVPESANAPSAVPPVSDSDTKEEFTREGISAAPGIVIGTAFVLDHEKLSAPEETIRAQDTENEIARFREALEKTKAELRKIKESLAAQIGDDHAKIFESHLLILADVTVIEETEAFIRDERRNAAWAFQSVLTKVVTSLRAIKDEYLADRSTDIVDVRRRVVRHLLGKRSRTVASPPEPSIIVAHELAPSETAQLNRKVILGYATDSGGRTSHTAILARSQGVAAVVALESASQEIETGDKLILDGNLGTVVVNPSRATLTMYRKEIRRFKKLEKQLLTLTGYPADTLDGRKFELVANIDLPEEVKSASNYGAEGIGLFRTEYFFIAQEKLPSEDEQFRVYRAVVQKMNGKPVTIRVLDIGGDKIADYIHSSPELNPFMGWRGIRFLLTRIDIFKTQLRAIYRASSYGKVNILLPLIVQLDEVTKARRICENVKEELRKGRFKFDDDVKFGVMIETPSAVAIADALAKEVDFFSIGTNDLIQYTMAVDRGNSKIAHLYQHLHPSIIRFLKMTVDAAHKRDIPATICGEMAVDPLSTVVLIGLQVDGFSCSPNMMPEVKRIIRSVT